MDHFLHGRCRLRPIGWSWAEDPKETRKRVDRENWKHMIQRNLKTSGEMKIINGHWTIDGFRVTDLPKRKTWKYERL